MADLAHPDAGAHLRVSLLALGATLDDPAGAVSFPYEGDEHGLSVRCAQPGALG